MNKKFSTVALVFFCLSLPLSIAGINIGLALLTLALLFSPRVQWNALKNPAFYALAAYCAAAFVSSLLGIDPAVSLGSLYKDLHKVWVLGLLLLALASEPAPWAFAPLGVGFAVAAVIGLWQTAAHPTLSAADAANAAWLRAHAFVHPVTYGEQLGLGWLGGFCFFRISKTGSARKAAIAFLIIVTAALIANQTRGALLGVGAGFAALCLLDKPLRRRAAWGALGGLGVLGAWEIMPTGGRSLLFLSRHLALRSSTGVFNPFLARWALWKVAWQSFRDHPWSGVGPGNYRTAFTLYFNGDIEGERVWGSAHNLYLHQLSERGILGVTALVAVLWITTAQAWRRARVRPNAWNLWAAAALIAFLVMNLTEVAFQNEQVASLVLFIWAWGEANARREAGQKIL